jgi:hypothetical protein
LCGCDRHVARFAQLPLADAIAATPLDHVDMHVILVETVRSRAEHGGEPRARGLMQPCAKLFRHLGVCEREHFAVDELQRAQVERIRQPVLAELGPGHAVAATALEGGRRYHGSQRRPALVCGRRGFVAQPVHHGLCHAAAEHGGGIDRDPLPVVSENRLQPDDVGRLARTRAGDRRQGMEDRKIGRQPPPACGGCLQRRVRLLRLGLIRRVAAGRRVSGPRPRRGNEGGSVDGGEERA